MRMARAGLVALFASPAACVLPAGAPCCAQDGDCADGVVCFEGRCAPQCDDDAQCADGERCDDGVCAAVVRDDACVTGGGSGA